MNGQMHISALMDQELDAVETEAQLARCSQDEALRAVWSEYHLVGDVMRQLDAAPGPDFSRRVMQQLSAEPVMLVPVVRPRPLQPVLSRSLAASLAVLAYAAWSVFDVPEPAIQQAEREHRVVRTESAQVSPYLVAHQEFSPATSLQGVAPYVRTVAEMPAR